MTKKENNYPWKTQKSGFEEALRYINGRKEGLIKSLMTPWKSFNNATTDGIEWNSLTIVGGRPATFKTGLKDQFVRESFNINGENHRVLEFSFEMVARISAIREFSSHSGKSYKYLCSADGKLSDLDLRRCKEYAELRVKYPVDIVEEPTTVNRFREIIQEYMEVHKKEGVYTNTVVTLDHATLVKRAAFEKTERDMLYNLGEAITDLKRKYPIAFFVLSQLNRNIDHVDRSKEGTYGNYVLESDIMGADAMLQHADTVVGLNRPGKQRIRLYGKDKYIIDNDRILVMHFLKCRNGDTGLSFFRGEFERMSIVEIPMPPNGQTR